jgi:AraC-like DNA-binding protein
MDSDMDSETLVTEINTAVVPPPERFELWREISARSHTRDVLTSDDQDDFLARMRTLHLGDMRMSGIAMPHLQVVRTPRSVRQFDPEAYQVLCVVAGGGHVTSVGCDARFRVGHIVVTDTSSPMTANLRAAPEGWSSLVLQLPRTSLPLPEQAVRRLVATPIPSHHGMAGAFSRWMADLHTHAHEYTATQVPTLASVTVDLLASVLGHCLDAEDSLPPEARRSALRVRIRGFIEQNLADPALTLQGIADAHHISLRHLHQLLAEDGVSPAAWIRHRRMELCRRDLADPRLNARPIRAIAARWAFTDPAHFSRLFRATYGMPPRDYRHLSHSARANRQRPCTD